MLMRPNKTETAVHSCLKMQIFVNDAGVQNIANPSSTPHWVMSSIPELRPANEEDFCQKYDSALLLYQYN